MKVHKPLTLIQYSQLSRNNQSMQLLHSEDIDRGNLLATLLESLKSYRIACVAA